MRAMLPAVLVAIGIGTAGAQTGSQSGAVVRPNPAPETTWPIDAGPIMSASDVREKLPAESYSTVSDLKREGNVYTAIATKNGQRMRLSVDAQTGAVAAASDAR
jgi:hypothetical protein